MIAITNTKKTMNFLKAMKAANGSTVTQYDDKIFVVHIQIEYGMIVFIASNRNFVLNITENNTMLTIR